MTPTNIPFNLAASYTIGSYILPGEPMNNIHAKINTKMRLNINSCTNIINGVKRGEFELGLIESPIFDKELIYIKWKGDELVICSKMELPPLLDKELLSNYRLICREKKSPTRDLIYDFLQKFDLSYESFNSLSEIENTTAAIQSVKWSKPNSENPTIAIVSNLAIEDEIRYKQLFKSRIYNEPIIRDFYIIVSKNNLNNSLVNIIIDELTQKKKKVS